MLGRFLHRALTHLRQNQVEKEMEKELKFHLEMETEDNLRRGMRPGEAQRAALRDFGGVDQVKEECRDVRRFRVLETLWQDTLFGFRILLKNRAFSVVAILTLALGIGANTAMFSIINGVLLRPLPYRDGSRLVVLNQSEPLAGVENLGFSVKDIEDFRAQSQSIDALVEHHSMSFLLLGGKEPERIQSAVVSANFFEVMGVRPLLGRTFVPDDDRPGAEAVLILSHAYWQRSHGGDPNIVGRVFRMNDRPHTVIGVLPAVPQYPEENDVYMPTSACPSRSAPRFIADRNARMMDVFGRLKSGFTADQARADVATIAARLQRDFPASYDAKSGYRTSVAPLQEVLTQRARPTLLLLLATTALVLLIACSNVANLSVARMARRQREMAVRSALGANRWRLVRQLLTENVVLAIIGGVLGVLAASAGLDMLVAFAARFTSRAQEVRLDGMALAFTLGLSVFTGLAAGIVPAMLVEGSLLSALKEGIRQSSRRFAHIRLRSALIVAQVSLSFVLLTGAGLMLRSLYNMLQVNPGYNPENVLVFPLTINWTKYKSAQQYKDLSFRLLDKTANEPGVLAAGMAQTYPLNPSGIHYGPYNVPLRIVGSPAAKDHVADYRQVSDGYFATIQVPLVSGRTFRATDNEESLPVAVINESMSRHYWGRKNPIGQKIEVNAHNEWQQATIVGVIGDIRQYGLNRAATDEIYRPLAQAGGASTILLRTSTDPEHMIAQIRKAVSAVDPEIAVSKIQTLEQVRSESLSSPRLTAVLLGLFAVLALVITTTGITGVLSLSVSQRTHEIGIRMALGASQTENVWMVMRQGLTLVLAGLALGVAGAILLSRWMSALLFSVEPTDFFTFSAVVVVLILAAAVSCFAPAHRVTAIDPLIALRSE